jgi:prepilin signal peptidase PulO-like enzyme (type II secretory pathway)
METLFFIYAFIFGAMIGSFLNVVILRMPLGKDIVYQSSHCPTCQHKLRFYHNIPILSFLFLRGKCAFCGVRISWRYPLIETLTGLISFWLFPEIVTADSMMFYVFNFAIACVFICHFFIDLDHHLLLDKLNIYLLVLILPYVFFYHDWLTSLMGAALGFGGPLLVTWLFYKIRGQVGLGGGDIKLFGILGLLLGPTGVMLNIFLSCFIGAIVGLAFIAFQKMSKDKPMPFGPFIILVASIQIFFPDLAHSIQRVIFLMA